MVAVLLMMWRLRLGGFRNRKNKFRSRNCKRSISFVGSLFCVVLVGVFEVAESLEICGF